MLKIFTKFYKEFYSNIKNYALYVGVIMIIPAILVVAISILWESEIALNDNEIVDSFPRTYEFSQFAFLEPSYSSSSVSAGISDPISNTVILRPTTSLDQALFYSSIVEVDDEVRLYYVCFDINRNIVNLCIAKKSDTNGGFEKLFDDRDNIVTGVDLFDGAHVIYHTDYGYILFYSTHDQTQNQWIHNIATSSDGIHFDDRLIDIFPYSSDSHNILMFDQWRNSFVAYLRSWNVIDLVGVDTQYRTVSRLELGTGLIVPHIPPIDNPLSNDYWPQDKRPVISQELQVVLEPDYIDPPNTHIYTPNVMTIPGMRNSYLAIPSIYSHFPDPANNGIRSNDGTIHLQYAFSSDGVEFRRGYRTLDLGDPYTGALQLFAANGLHVEGDFINLYVVAMDNLHQDNQVNARIIQSQFEYDKFTHLSADADSIVEYEIGSSRNSLIYNSFEIGEYNIEFELLNENHDVIPGFERYSYEALTLDDSWKSASWNGIDQFPENYSIMRIYMPEGTELYSYMLLNDEN